MVQWTEGLLVILMLGMEASSHGQCGDWETRYGGGECLPLQVYRENGSGVVDASTVWDPDGPGPQPPLLVLRFAFQDGFFDRPFAALWAYGGWGNWRAMDGGESHTGALGVYDGQLISGDAYWDGSTWKPLSGEVRGSVDALTVYNGELIAGGFFFGPTGGAEPYCVARWSGPTWERLGSILGGTVWGVTTLTVYKGELIAGGNQFINLNSPEPSKAPGVARWDGANWVPLGSGLSSEHCQLCQISALTVYNGELIAGGAFAFAGSEEACNIASWDGSTWRPLGNGLNGPVYALTVYNCELIASGGFSAAGGAEARGFARWNGRQWRALDSWNMPVRSLAVYESELMAGEFIIVPYPEWPFLSFCIDWTTWRGVNYADLNHDCRVDRTDLVMLEACASGPAMPYRSGCALLPDGQGVVAADFDHDNDVDQSDFGVFQRCWSGANKPADPNCVK